MKEIFTPSREYKANIILRNDGNYQIKIYKWTHEIVPGVGEVCEPFWSEVRHELRLTDTEDSAQNIAHEELRNVSGENI